MTKGRLLEPRSAPERDRDNSTAAGVIGVHSLVPTSRYSMWLRWLLLSASLAAMMDSGRAQNVTYRYKVKRASFISKLHELWRQYNAFIQGG